MSTNIQKKLTTIYLGRNRYKNILKNTQG